MTKLGKILWGGPNRHFGGGPNSHSHVLNAISMFLRPGSLLPPRVRRLGVAFKLTPVNTFVGIVDIVDSALIKGLLVLGIRS